mmetsp:Transcript_842/g.2355  ORF Transcript_842/g.2355 Transcript_842/m.2355 type:complete len:150 (+) Transcript_842:170-619(+)
MIQSQSLTVDSLCAMTMVVVRVVPESTPSILSLLSVSLSSALVASSSTSSFGRRASARARARRCPWPPDNVSLPLPLLIHSSTPPRRSTNSVACAASSTSETSTSLRSSFPYRTTSLTFPTSSPARCSTTPTTRRHRRTSMEDIGTPFT